MELTPINTGSTIHRPARRGLATFSALQAQPFDVWRGLRGKKDRIKEVVVLGGLKDVNRHLLDHKLISATACPAS